MRNCWIRVLNKLNSLIIILPSITFESHKLLFILPRNIKLTKLFKPIILIGRLLLTLTNDQLILIQHSSLEHVVHPLCLRARVRTIVRDQINYTNTQVKYIIWRLSVFDFARSGTPLYCPFVRDFQTWKQSPATGLQTSINSWAEICPPCLVILFSPWNRLSFSNLWGYL